MQYSTCPIDGSFAMEIMDMRLWEAQTPQTVAGLRRLFGEHGILVFRRQSLSEDEFADFCSHFGVLERTVRTDWASKVRPEIGLITNLKDFDGRALGGLGDGEVEWHSDQAYMLNPATGSGLYGVEIAHQGGTTSWANLALAYQALPERLKAQVEGKRAIFSYPKRLRGFKGADQMISEEARQRTPDVVHSLVHVNPVSGQKALYLDPTTTIGIVGMPDDEANALLDELAQFAVRPEFLYNHRWQVGDVLLWSNGFLMHRREPFPSSERRLLKRSTMILPRDFHIVPDGQLLQAA
ncbi:MAG TPA: TauD/TfdA family dioxygenase [Burkholderiales bacterium]|nr:TauD/TfdA family dioxygenase [Burkholderiales bacterium]